MLAPPGELAPSPGGNPGSTTGWLSRNVYDKINYSLNIKPSRALHDFIFSMCHNLTNLGEINGLWLNVISLVLLS